MVRHPGGIDPDLLASGDEVVEGRPVQEIREGRPVRDAQADDVLAFRHPGMDRPWRGFRQLAHRSLPTMPRQSCRAH
jgi:hypothetical protein